MIHEAKHMRIQWDAPIGYHVYFFFSGTNDHYSPNATEATETEYEGFKKLRVHFYLLY